MANYSKRGSTLCSVCGRSNGNRAEVCKECKTPLPKRVKKTPQRALCSVRRYNIDVSHIVPHESLSEDSIEVYSVRIRS